LFPVIAPGDWTPVKHVRTLACPNPGVVGSDSPRPLCFASSVPWRLRALNQKLYSLFIDRPFALFTRRHFVEPLRHVELKSDTFVINKKRIKSWPGSQQHNVRTGKSRHCACARMRGMRFGECRPGPSGLPDYSRHPTYVFRSIGGASLNAM